MLLAGLTVEDRPPAPPSSVHAQFMDNLTLAGKEQALWEMRPELRAELVQRIEPDAGHLARDFPEIDVTLWENFRHVARAPDAAD